MRIRAKDHPKLHHEDPSGFWKLVRTGESLPRVGQEILFVYDVRGTTDEVFRKVLMNIAAGDAYRITNDQLERDGKILGGASGALLAETFKLPTEEYKPSTHTGVVAEVGFDEVMQEHWIGMKPASSVWHMSFSPDCIIYWAPFPTAPDTYTPRSDEFSNTRALAWNELLIRDRWEARKTRNEPLKENNEF